jgi:hypothetical protein
MPRTPNLRLSAWRTLELLNGTAVLRPKISRKANKQANNQQIDKGRSNTQQPGIANHYAPGHLAVVLLEVVRGVVRAHEDDLEHVLIVLLLPANPHPKKRTQRRKDTQINTKFNACFPFISTRHAKDTHWS